MLDLTETVSLTIHVLMLDKVTIDEIVNLERASCKCDMSDTLQKLKGSLFKT